MGLEDTIEAAVEAFFSKGKKPLASIDPNDPALQKLLADAIHQTILLPSAQALMVKPVNLQNCTFKGPLTGTWILDSTVSQNSVTGSSLNASSGASSKGDWFETGFVGERLGIIYATDSDHGKFEVWVDGQQLVTVDSYSVNFQVDFIQMITDGLAPGPHRVHIQVSGAKNQNSSNYNVSIHGILCTQKDNADQNVNVGTIWYPRFFQAPNGMFLPVLSMASGLTLTNTPIIGVAGLNPTYNVPIPLNVDVNGLLNVNVAPITGVNHLVAPWYQPNFKSQSNDFEIYVGPHGETTRFTYSVPANRLALVSSGFIQMLRGASPTVLGGAFITLNFIASRAFRIDEVQSAVGTPRYASVGWATVLTGGQVITATDADNSTGGAYNFIEAFTALEFDASTPTPYDHVKSKLTRKLKVGMIGSGTSSDPYRVDLPNWQGIKFDTDIGLKPPVATAIVLVPDDEFDAQGDIRLDYFRKKYAGTEWETKVLTGGKLSL